MGTDPANAAELIRLIDAGRHEEAFGVEIGEGRGIEAIALKAKHADSADTLKSLHFAEAALRNESAIDKVLRLRNVGVELVNRGQPDAAARYLEKVVTLRGDPLDHLDLGYTYLRAGRYDDAAQPLEYALSKESELSAGDKGRPDQHLAELYAKQSRFTAAQQHERAAVVKMEAVKESQRLIAAEDWYNKGEEARANGRHQDAVSYFDRSLDLESKSAKSWFYKALSLAELGRWSESRRCYEEVIRVNPRDHAAWANNAVCASRLRHPDEALHCCDEALKIEPHNPLLLTNKGMELEGLRRFNEALVCFDRAIEYADNFKGAWAAKAHLFHIQKKYKKAIRCYDHVLSIDSRDPGSWVNKSRALLGLHQIADALECCQRGTDLAPRPVSDWIHRGDLLRFLHRHREALACYNAALGADKNNAASWNGKGVALACLGQFGDAHACFQRSVEIEPSNGTYMTNLSRSISGVYGFVFAIVLWALFGGCTGAYFGDWRTGIVIGILNGLPPAGFWVYHFRLNGSLKQSLTKIGLMTIASLAGGAAIGSYMGGWKLGLKIGISLLAFSFLIGLFSKWTSGLLLRFIRESNQTEGSVASNQTTPQLVMITTRSVESDGSNRGTQQVGRNDPCPCGSGKKFKKCHGANLE